MLLLTKDTYTLQYKITPAIAKLIAEISELVGRNSWARSRRTVRRNKRSNEHLNQVKSLANAIGTGEVGISDLMRKFKLLHRPTLKQNYIVLAIESGFIE